VTNASNIIFADKDDGVWGFADSNDGLPREPFVEGPNRMIHRAVSDIANAASAPGLFLAMGTVGLAREDGGGKLVSIGAILLCHCQGPAEPRSI